LQKVQEGCSRGERPAGEQAEALGTTGGRDAGDQAGLRSATGTENTGSRERQEKDDGASPEQSAVAEGHAYHRRLRDQQSRPGPRDQWEGRAVLRQEYEAKIRS